MVNQARFNPLNPHDALKHHFKKIEEIQHLFHVRI